MASREEVERELHRLMKRFERADSDVKGSVAAALPDRRVIEISLTDLGTSYWTELSGGAMAPLREGAPPQTDIRIRMTSDHLVDLAEGRASMFSSYLAGRVKVEASVGDLLRLRKLA